MGDEGLVVATLIAIWVCHIWTAGEACVAVSSEGALAGEPWLSLCAMPHIEWRQASKSKLGVMLTGNEEVGAVPKRKQ